MTPKILAKIGLAKIVAKIGFGQNWPGQNHDGQNGIGQSRSFPPVMVEWGHHCGVCGNLDTKEGRPSATTSGRLQSNRLCSAKSMSRTNTFARTLAPPSLHTHAATDSNAQPLRPNTPAVASRWPRRRVDGHTDSGEQTREGANEACEARALGRVLRQSLTLGPQEN